jgi:hypothetical protein
VIDDLPVVSAVHQSVEPAANNATIVKHVHHRVFDHAFAIAQGSHKTPGGPHCVFGGYGTTHTPGVQDHLCATHRIRPIRIDDFGCDDRMQRAAQEGYIRSTGYGQTITQVDYEPGTDVFYRRSIRRINKGASIAPARAGFKPDRFEPHSSKLVSGNSPSRRRRNYKVL